MITNAMKYLLTLALAAILTGCCGKRCDKPKCATSCTKKVDCHKEKHCNRCNMPKKHCNCVK